MNVNARFVTLLAMTLGAAAMRLLPHPPNFTPLAAMALFGGARFESRRAAFAVPLAAMWVSDAALGFPFHRLMPFVYGSFAMIVCLGLELRDRRSPLAIGGAALAASLLFFVVTNLGVWFVGGFYPTTLGGLVACYVAGIPFFRNTLAGDALYTGLLFGGFALGERSFPALHEARAR